MEAEFATENPDEATGWPIGRQDLGRLLTGSRPVEGRALQIVCAIFAVGYLGITLTRPPQAGHPELFAIRIMVIGYATLGTLLARRFTWLGYRVYAVGLALLLPLSTSYIEAVRGNHIGDVVFTAIATLGPLLLLAAGWDYVFVPLALIAGNAVILAVMPPAALPLDALWTMLGGGDRHRDRPRHHLDDLRINDGRERRFLAPGPESRAHAPHVRGGRGDADVQ